MVSRRDRKLPLPGRKTNSHDGLVVNVKWFQIYLAFLQERFTLTFAVNINLYAEWAGISRDNWTLKPAFLSQVEIYLDPGLSPGMSLAFVCVLSTILASLWSFLYIASFLQLIQIQKRAQLICYSPAMYSFWGLSKMKINQNTGFQAKVHVYSKHAIRMHKHICICIYLINSCYTWN